MVIVAACALLFVAHPQSPDSGVNDATGSVGRIFWPPRQQTVRYDVRLTKTLDWPADLQSKIREARKEGDLHTDRRPPKQSVAVRIAVELVPGKKLTARYTSKIGKHSLRMKLVKGRPKKKKTTAGALPPDPPSPLTNKSVHQLWGWPDQKGAKALSVVRERIDRDFVQLFEYRDKKGVDTVDMRGKFADHLLPVLWVHPLPCWIGEVTEVLDLSGETIVSGKTLLRDTTRSLPLGYRATSVSIKFLNASKSGFSMRYELQIKQTIAEKRDGAKLLGKSYEWHIDVKGAATFSLARSRFTKIEEKVTGRPAKLPDASWSNVRDESFVGSIRVVEVDVVDKGKKGRRR